MIHLSFTAIEDMEVMAIDFDIANLTIERQSTLLHKIAQVIEMRKNVIDAAKRAKQNEQRSTPVST